MGSTQGWCVLWNVVWASLQSHVEVMCRLYLLYITYIINCFVYLYCIICIFVSYSLLYRFRDRQSPFLPSSKGEVSSSPSGTEEILRKMLPDGKKATRTRRGEKEDWRKWRRLWAIKNMKNRSDSLKSKVFAQQDMRTWASSAEYHPTPALRQTHTLTLPLWSWFVIAASPGTVLIFDWLPHYNLEEVECCYADTSQGQPLRVGKREWCVTNIESFSVTCAQFLIPGEVKGWWSTKDCVNYSKCLHWH